LEQLYRLKSLGTHDAQANPLYNAFTFSPSDLIKGNSQ
jgi:hypothetical protein